jgi:hypothetical protein
MGHPQASILVDVIVYNFYHCKQQDLVLYVKFDMLTEAAHTDIRPRL